MSSNDNLDAEFEAMLRVVDGLQRARPDAWPTWRQVARRLRGTEEEADRYAAIASLPKYQPYFAQDHGIRVKLTQEGFEHLRSLAPVKTADPNSPAAVATAVRRYAGKLTRIHLRADELLGGTSGAGKVVHAFSVQMKDGSILTGTPVEYRPGDRGAWTRGTVVGQDPARACIYVAADTQITPDALPGVLAVDRGFMLAQLAKRVESFSAIPPRVAPLLAGTDGDPGGVAVRNAARAATGLAWLRPPWTRVLWGPPGGGKTFAIAHLVVELLRRNRDARILLVAHSNLAVDVLIEETVSALEAGGLGTLVSTHNVLRYGYARKESVLARHELLGPPEVASISKNIRQVARQLAEAERRRADEQRLAALRSELLAAQLDLQAMVFEHAKKSVVVATSIPLTYLPHSPIGDLRWSGVFVDEAIMVQPAMCYYLGALADDAFLLAGDPQQLGPIVEEEHRLEGVERKWMGCDVFQMTRVSVGSGEARRIETGHPLLVRITEQRRCNRGIWDEIRHLYPGVRCAAQDSSGPSGHAVDPLPGHPVVLLDTSGSAESPCLPAKRSWENRASAELCMELATAMLGDNDDVSVAIITPFRAQWGILMKLLRSERAARAHCQRIQVGTVHQFQGSAADVVIFDVVEDSTRTYLTRLNLGDTGTRLLNVAISRARHKLIVVANRAWHQRCTHKHDNSLLWELVVDRPNDEVLPVLGGRDVAANTPHSYESPYEALLGQTLMSALERYGLVTQYRICRDDGSLISRADFAVPDLKYAIYVDGAKWHLTRKGWRRDRRLRTELAEQGWEVSVFGASQVQSACTACVDEVMRCVDRLAADRPATTRRKPCRAA